MASKFNPYTSWLQIPADQLPPDYYRILGLRRFETDDKKIETSVEKRVAFLQDVSNGPHVAEAQKLLSEVAKARLCLRKPERKQKYDQKLKGHLNANNIEIEVLEITELPDPDEWLFKGALPEATSHQNVKVTRAKKRAPLAAASPQPLAKQPEPPLKNKMFWPIVVLANLSLLSIATAGIYWIGSNAAIVEDHSETKIQPTSVATPSVPKSTEPVSEDFESEELSKSPRTFESPIGKWQLPASCEFWNKDEGQRHLHLIADEPIEIEVDSTIAFPAKCLMNIEMRFRQDSPNPNTIMQLSISANGKDWLPIEANESNPSVKTRRNLKPVPSKIQFVIREPATSHIRIKYTGKGDPNQKSKSGILIGNFDLKPIDPDEPEEPKF